jgi:hypothetical protein
MKFPQIRDTGVENQKPCNGRPVVGKGSSSVLLANSSEYKEGEVAFRGGLTTRDNPYSFRSPEYWRWQEGLLGNGRPRQWPVSPVAKSRCLVDVGPRPEDTLPLDDINPLAVSCYR